MARRYGRAGYSLADVAAFVFWNAARTGTGWLNALLVHTEYPLNKHQEPGSFF